MDRKLCLLIHAPKKEVKAQTGKKYKYTTAAAAAATKTTTAKT